MDASTVADEFPGKYSEMQRAPAWRLWTGVALATLVVWMIVGLAPLARERCTGAGAATPSILPLIAMEAVFRAVRELAEALFELRPRAADRA